MTELHHGQRDQTTILSPERGLFEPIDQTVVRDIHGNEIAQDPMNLNEIIIAGAAGGAAKEIAQNAWQCGQKWIASYFRDHKPEAIAKANANAESCINLIAQKVNQLEEDAQLNRALFEKALNEPDFGVLLQKTLIGSAQTGDTDKQELLANLLTNRLTAETDSLYSVVSHLACEAVTHCTARHLRILGFASSIYLECDRLNMPFDTNQEFQDFCKWWFEHRFTPYVGLEARMIDLFHLEAVSCISTRLPANGILDPIVSRWKSGDFQLSVSELESFTVGPTIQTLWGRGHICGVKLTTVGQLIGTMVSDSICGGKPTSFESWKSA